MHPASEVFNISKMLFSIMHNLIKKDNHFQNKKDFAQTRKQDFVRGMVSKAWSQDLFKYTKRFPFPSSVISSLL